MPRHVKVLSAKQKGEKMKDDRETREKFSKIMWGLAEIFGGEISKPSMELRFSALQDFDIDDIEITGIYLLKYRKAKFPAVPTVVEFVELLEKDVANIDIAAESQADFVLKRVRTGSPADFCDPITKKLMENRWTYHIWSKKVLEKDIPWWRKEFVKAYRRTREDQRMVAIAHAEARATLEFFEAKRIEEKRRK